MQTTLRFAPVPRIVWLLIVLVLAIAPPWPPRWPGREDRTAAALLTGRNSATLYAAGDGDIYALNPTTNNTKR